MLLDSFNMYALVLATEVPISQAIAQAHRAEEVHATGMVLHHSPTEDCAPAQNRTVTSHKMLWKMTQAANVLTGPLDGSGQFAQKLPNTPDACLPEDDERLGSFDCCVDEQALTQMKNQQEVSIMT